MLKRYQTQRMTKYQLTNDKVHNNRPQVGVLSALEWKAKDGMIAAVPIGIVDAPSSALSINTPMGFTETFSIRRAPFVAKSRRKAPLSASLG
jgi:hypothetical protein